LVLAIPFGDQTRFLGDRGIQLVSLQLISSLCLRTVQSKQDLPGLHVLSLANVDFANDTTLQMLDGLAVGFR
jgi:hypothetical protein